MQLVSVIMPAYNAAPFIQDAVESLLAQTYRSWELWVIDDGSTDRTLEIIEAFEDPRIFVKSQSNQGVSAARNLGLEAARGEWVAFLDADDLWLPHKLEAQLKKADGRQVLVYGDYLTLSGEKTTHQDQLGLCPDFPREGYLYDSLIQHDYIGTLSVLAPKEAVDQIGGFDPGLHAPADWDYWIRLSVGREWVYVDEPVAIYRDHSKGISKDFGAFEADIAVLLERYLFHGATSAQRRFGCWINYRHLCHHAVRAGQTRKAFGYWVQAVQSRRWTYHNLASLAYVLLKPFYR